jgi:hypothetical protein
MATVGQYLVQLQQAGGKMAGQMGVDVTRSMKSDRVVARATLGLLAVLIKLLVDKGVITDADLLTAYGAAGGGSYTPEPDEPPPAPP